MTAVVDLAVALERARALADGPTGQRRLLGIAGAPGAGKSTVAEAVVRDLGERAVLVPMDGFHLAQSELERLGRAGRKGAADTFDAAGFVALLRRVRAAGPQPRTAGAGSGSGEVVYAPRFDRSIEEPVAGAVPVPPHVPLVVVEGNYLLNDEGPWAAVAPLLDETWFLEVDEAVRVERLVARHVAFGKDPAAARSWATGPDQRNAVLVAAGRDRADVVVRL